MTKARTGSARTVKGRPHRWSRRGVVSVLSMMFLVLFGSLAAAMGIAAMGNLRTATTHLHVMRAMSAAETGMAVASKRIELAARRFVVEKGVVDAGFGTRLWNGDFIADDGEVDVLGPPYGHDEPGLPTGLAQALQYMHGADENVVVVDGIDEPTINPAPADAGNDYMDDGWVVTPALTLAVDDANESGHPAAFQITYAPLANGTDIRAIVTGYDFDHTRNNVPLRRVIMQDFRIVKRVEHAVVSPTRIMIGKNVMITGDLGAIYDQVEVINGDPLIVRSDFGGLDPVLDSKLADLYEGIVQFDADGDNRLRVGHAIEDDGIPSGDVDYDGDGSPDGAFADATQDGYVDEFDVFIRHYDKDGDNRVTLSAALIAGTPAEGRAPEFVTSGGEEIDDDLALLIDSSNPDRNRNGLYGFEDLDLDGVWDAGTEQMLDYDPVEHVYLDQVLGYRDGYLDRKDLYAKVSGRLVFRVTEDAWTAAQGEYHERLAGPIRPDAGQSPMRFGAPESELPDLDAARFSANGTALQTAANGDAFDSQVAANLGVGVGDLPTYVEGGSPGDPRYFRVDPDTDADGLPDNYATAYFEKMPFNAPVAADWYYRPVYENMLFKDVQIPMGTNALFLNCTFVGVTYIRTYTANANPSWTNYGRLIYDSGAGRPMPSPGRDVYGDEAGETEFPIMLPPTAVPPEQMISMADPPLDKADIPADRVPMIVNYDDLPDPMIIDGKRITDTKAFSNNVRFHDCLIVGSIVSDTTEVFTNVRNKIQFTGATRVLRQHPDYPDDPEYNPEPSDMATIETSSLMVPNYSVDVGSFNSPPSQNVLLKGAIIAGVMDIRGNATIDGALLLTFAPTPGEAPLVDFNGNPIGNPALFNTTLGYFGPDDGDEESVDPDSLPIVDGVPIVGWDLDGDGLVDLGPDETPTAEQMDAGATAVPFWGYGRVNLRFDPDMALPDGILLPLSVSPRVTSYREGGSY